LDTQHHFFVADLRNFDEGCFVDFDAVAALAAKNELGGVGNHKDGQ